MHDPDTVAFEIPNPFSWSKGWDGKWKMNTLITIWHVDPETDGSDDSCGWSRPRLTKEQRDRLKWVAKDEAREPWFQARRAKKTDQPAEAETLLRGALVIVAQRLDVKVSWDEVSLWAAELLHHPFDNFRGSLCHLPGWHTNFEEDCEDQRIYEAERFFCCLARFILRRRRPWWKHPRWHFWHWELQVHPLQAFKRWAFSRCATCGKRFPWGYAPVTTSWHSTGPLWFRSQKDVHHHECHRSSGVGTEAKAS